MSETAIRPKQPWGLAVFYIIAGVIGWIAAFNLLEDKIELLQNKNFVPSCNISILVSCTPNMNSPQGSVFDFPNPILGVGAFMAPLILGVAILAGARFARWFWVLFNLGVVGGIVFVIWLMSQSIFDLHTLCPWCMVVWTMMIPMFWYTTFYNLKTGNIPVGERMRAVFAGLYSWAWVITLASYAAVAVLAQVRLNWLNEFAVLFS